MRIRFLLCPSCDRKSSAAIIRLLISVLLIYSAVRFPVYEFFSGRLSYLAASKPGIGPEERAGYYEKALRLDPVHSERAAYELGMLYVSMGDHDRAIESFNRSISLRNYAEVYNDLGNCYYLKGDRKNAAANWRTAIELGLPDPAARSRIKKNLNIISEEDDDEQDPGSQGKRDTGFAR